MRWRTLLSAPLLASLTIVAPAWAEIATPERQILAQSVATYGRLKRYLLSGVIQVEVKSERGPQSQRAPFLVAADGTGRVRDQVSSGTASGMFVSDGLNTVIYSGQLGQYVRKPGNADSVLKQFPNKGIAGMIVGRYKGLLDGAREAHRLPDEKLTVNGAPRTCTVLDVTYDPPAYQVPITEEPRRYWIDRETHLVIRQRSVMHADAPQLGGKVDQEETVTFERAAIDAKLPDTLWVFRPPPGARLVDEFKTGQADLAAGITGKPATDFTLKDLQGRSHSLKSLRGKTVLLDFWATWCGPCRITMPQVAKIHEQYKNRGVEVMSINLGETAEKAGAYIAKNGYAFTTLLDQDRSVAMQYKVNGIPTLVVIDAQGNVSDYLVGARDEAALKAALQKAGVK